MIRRIGNLQVIEVNKGMSKKAVVLLHGYGADYTDLAPLAQEMVDENAAPTSHPTFYFPNAPLTVDIGPHMQGRAWFPLDVMALQRMLMTGDRSEFETKEPPGLDEATAAVCELIRSLSLKPHDVVLGGFSQGAMIALNAALSMPDPPSRLMLLSTGIVALSRWQAILAKGSHRFRVLQSHGDQDPILPFAGAERLRKLLEENGSEVTFIPFHGGHGIAPNVLKSATRFIAEM